MRIALVTPAPPGSTSGNRVSSNRYTKLFREMGHQVRVSTRYDSEVADVLVALHARRSGPSVQRFHRLYPDKPIIVVLTGTDLYRDLPDKRTALRSLEAANRLVVLQPLGIQALPARFRKKAVSIIQSARPLAANGPTRRLTGQAGATFVVVQLAHLRPVKDPFLVARAARYLPEDSPVVIQHFGAAMQPASEDRAVRFMQAHSRYKWMGERSHGVVLRRLAAADLLVLSSKLEGGANAICEALACGVPVVCSRIPGSMGLLGENYPGCFSVGDAAALADLMQRAATDHAFMRRLREACRQRQKLVTPARERASWRRLLRSTY